MTWFIISLKLAVIAFIYTVRLTEPGMLLGPLKGWAVQTVGRWPWTEQLLKPFILCIYCVSGQMALWTLVFYGWLHLQWVMSIIDTLYFLSLTILFAQIINKYFNEGA